VDPICVIAERMMAVHFVFLLETADHRFDRRYIVPLAAVSHLLEAPPEPQGETGHVSRSTMI
jgi:hypothetical protein